MNKLSDKLSSIGGQKKASSEDDQSLVTILETRELRGELTLLVANCTESQRKTITDAFDASLVGQPADTEAELKVDETKPNPNVDLANADADALEKQRKKQKTREKELSAPKMQELKSAALEFFDEWRESVLLRVGDVVNSRETASDQKNKAIASSPPKRSTQTRKVGEEDEAAGTVLRELYPPVSTPLAELEEAKRVLVLHSMLLLLLSLEHYSSHSRILMLYLTSSLRLPLRYLTEDETKVATGLLEAAKQMNADEETKKKAEENATSRKWKVGLASVAGAALIGVTGGLAAPLLAAGVGTVMGGLGLGATAAAGYLGTLAGSTVLVGGLFGAYGGKMTGKMVDAYAAEVTDFGFVPLGRHRAMKNEKENRRLRVAIGISGWLTEKGDIVAPWRVIDNGIEGFALRFELAALMNLGNAITTMVKSAAWGFAKKEIIKRTVFASLSAALWPIGLLKISRVVDNPFSVAKAKADKAGEVLADAIINKAQGERPVTLIGYSLGARVIYTCLQSLAQRKAFGLVESVVLLGAPTPSTGADWRRLRAVVSGRVVNVYSTDDYVLGFLYRTSSIQYGIAGLQKVSGVQGIENVDVSELVSGHTRYRYLTGQILKKIGFEDVDLVQADREAEQMRAEEAKEEKQGEEGTKDPELEALEMEQEVEQKSKKGLMGWTKDKLSLSSGGAAGDIGTVGGALF
ncbi:uncharacterized protein K452DRAFT_272040 [Aplosporella prunicola CBS 121167]|uniref:DUF726-domain-containing protein n=1 Tax=Aplosporella prunicola CBS 121167 TaxID=1176127 RepID=A0A6A6BD52_9PEZI|nr:uncharacterized protein K452DRAFT_272040 [Aplosporella prunicola CBS 121167]KAF2141303.1 hypothetical protein K452DRAFT_272040 [Aplosporella prunicola CBS 121167]